MTVEWGSVTCGELVEAIEGELFQGERASIIDGIETDSRKLKPGQLFWALKGDKYDGHDFIDMASKRGASGIVTEKSRKSDIPAGVGILSIGVNDTLKALGDLAGWWRREHGIPVAAITGSTGKTTTKEMTAGILELSGTTLKNQGNFNNLVGLPITLIQLTKDHERAVLELGMNRRGEIGRLTEIAGPDIGLITNIGRAHLEGLGDIRGVAKAKMELLEMMPSESHVILNGDDQLLMETAKPFLRKVMTFGMNEGNDIKAQKVRNFGIKGTSFELVFKGEAITIGLKVPGNQNIYNALSAAAIAFSMNETPEKIAEGLSAFGGISGRFSVKALPGGFVLVDDTYNSNPASLRASIEALKGMAVNGGRVLVGLGEMMELGAETSLAHQEAGAMVAELGAHYFFAVGEHASEMVQGAVDKGFSQERAIIVGNQDEMANRFQEILKEGDLIFLKGSRKAGLDKVAKLLGTATSKEV